MSGPLRGVRVLDCGRWMSAPVCARFLADLGADVTKIEGRGHPDPFRGMVSPAAMERRGGDTSSAAAIPNSNFDISNRGKRSIALDPAKVRGREILYALIDRSDVLVHNWRRKEVERLGLDFETLSKRNPRLIYAAASGWGPNGPDADEPALDGAAIARAGMMYLWGGPDMPPLAYTGGLADQVTGMFMVEAILAALFARTQDGKGQSIDVSVLGSMVALESAEIQGQLLRGFGTPRRGRSTTTNPLNTYYKCADGKWFVLCMYQADRYWPAVCKVMGIPELERDPRFKDLAARGRNAPELIAMFDVIFATRPRSEWARLCKDNGLIYAAVQTIPEVVEDPQLAPNDYVLDFDHSEWGRVRVVGFPYRFSATPLALERQAPEYGQHTEEVLLELGYTWDRIQKLREEEVI